MFGGSFATAKTVLYIYNRTTERVDDDTRFPYGRVRLEGHRSTKDVFGKRATVVLIGSRSDERQVSRLKEQLAIVPKPPFNLMVVTDDPDQFRAGGLLPANTSYSIGSQFPDLLRTFRGSPGNPSWLVYDDQGTLRGRGTWDSDSLRYFVRTVVAKDGELTGDRLADLARTSVSEDLRLIAQASAPRVAPVTFVLLVEKVTSGCPIYRVIEGLKQHSRARETPVIAVALGDLSASQLAVVKANFALPFSTQAGSASLQSWWSELKSSYGLARVNGAVLVVTNGHISGAATTSAEFQSLGVSI